MLRRKEEFEAALDRLKQEIEGTVRVASIYSVGLSEMVQLEQEFAAPGGASESEYLRPEKVYSGRCTWPMMPISAWSAIQSRAARSTSSHGVRRKWCWPRRPIIRSRPPADLARRSQRTRLHRLRRRATHPPRGRPLPPRARRRGEHQMLHFDNMQMIKEAVTHGVGGEHHAASRHARRDRAGPS